MAFAAAAALGSSAALQNVPAYDWYHGCGPTGAGSLLGYWDLHGFPNLFEAAGSDVYLTSNVRDRLSSPAHNAKYDPTPDNSSLPIPPKTSIADWFLTSKDPLKYGWSYQHRADDALSGYPAYRGYAFDSSYEIFGESEYHFTWDDLTGEIDARRPVLLLVDSDGDGGSDHFVVAFGYDDRGSAGKWYACYTGWHEAETVSWKRFVGGGNSWGVTYGTYARPPAHRWAAGSGNWATAANWNYAVPTSANEVRIDSFGTVEIASGRAEAFDLTVGYSSAGRIVQTGGQSTVGGAMLIGGRSGAEGTFMISGGTLDVHTLQVGQEAGGRFIIADASAEIIVRDQLTIGPYGVLEAVRGSVIRMTGSAFANQSTDPESLAGLANVLLLFEGGGETTDPFEVGGADFGPGPAGLESNFALDALILGGQQPGRMQLLDEIDNQPDWQGAEALYIEHLTIAAGSYLDLNGLSLYVTRLDDLGGTIAGGQIRGTVIGDVNLDGVVDSDDLSLLLVNWGRDADWSGGNFNFDATINDDDLSLLLVNWTVPQQTAAAAVPEPTTICLLCLLGIMPVRIRRGRTVA